MITPQEIILPPQTMSMLVTTSPHSIRTSTIRTTLYKHSINLLTNIHTTLAMVNSHTNT